ncbi:hypothetical protein LSM04_008439 [Trypanosoma melophagium]|uniref:uncharacterized protein n=1 Tax=Trypanosoma melophagium TaxID=715481 RepID=UPI00351A85DD|nr:hypothetical protein LSM04_008439 [Trypanosoma melophagium]
MGIWRDRWQACCNAVSILWTVGGRLRTVYNGSKSEEERRKDRRATHIRLVFFLMAVVMFATVDSYGDAAVALRSVIRRARRLLLRKKSVQ